LLAWEVQVYHLAEYLTEFVLYFMLVFSPWAFGTTEPWSIGMMNACGYALGILLAIKWMIRWNKGYPTARWPEQWTGKIPKRQAIFAALLGMLTLAILGYGLIAAVNARSRFNSVSFSFEYHDYLKWLPHSFDSRATWDAFWKYTALACSFWATRDWLIGKSKGEWREQRAPPLLPIRLRRLLWVALLSGGLLGLEGIAQRVWGSPKLLFLIKPEIHQSAQTQFGSYAYRSNAAQYFNLLWPVGLGFWWYVHRSPGRKPIFRHILLASITIMAACPIISTARGAALVDAGMLGVAALVLLIRLCFFDDVGDRGRNIGSVVWVILFLAGTLALGFGLGWRQLRPRMDDFRIGLRDREELYARARPIARDYSWFGTGPGTFEQVFQFYRISPDGYWPAQLHNDWLETRITFGRIGSAMIALALCMLMMHSFAAGIGYSGSQWVILIWLSLAGCLIQARWDFPLQVYSTLFLFIVLCAALMCLSREKGLAHPRAQENPNVRAPRGSV
jgi:hypothetical protein